MNTIYYAIVVVSPSRDPLVFRKPTNFPFPSPLGTAKHINFVDGGFGVVSGYSHGDNDDFYVFMSPMHLEGQKHIEIRDNPYHDYFFILSDDEFEGNKECLIEDGWDLEEDYIASYPDPFHQCRRP